MSYRGVSQPASYRAPMTVGSSNRFLGGTSSSTTTSSALNSRLYGTSTSATAPSSSMPSPSYPSSSYNNNSRDQQQGTTSTSSYLQGMGEPSYSGGPSFDRHGHALNRGTASSSSSGYGRTTPTTSSQNAASTQYYSEATQRLLRASEESSSAANRYSSSILPPSRSVVERNPLYGSSLTSTAALREQQREREERELQHQIQRDQQQQQGYYRESTGAHLYGNTNTYSPSHHSNGSGSPNSGGGGGSVLHQQQQHRAPSAGISTSSQRRTVSDYSTMGTTSAAYGANVRASEHTANRFAPSNSERKFLRDDAQDSDEDGPHISLANPGTNSVATSGLYGRRTSGTFNATTTNNYASSSSPSSSSIPSSKATALSASSSSVARNPLGLRNIGNTCYMNASLQCILHGSGVFLNALPNALNESASGKSKLSKALMQLAKQPSLQELMTVKAGAATLNHEFHGGRQNDAHEFIREFLHALHLELNRVGKGTYREMKDIDGESDADAAKRWFAYFRSHDDSIVTDYFGGFMRSTTVCGHCNHRSLSFSPVWDLSLSMGSSSSQNNIPAMLKDFMKVDNLGSDSAFSCEKCKKKKLGKRQSLLVNWPRVLVLHLCRFTYSGSRNNQQVDFPARLDASMIPFPSSGAPTPGNAGNPLNGYSLAGVVLHRGTANFGHYIGLVKPPGSRSWFHCDDSSVSVISESEVLRHRTEAYVLFYTMDDE